MGKIEGFMFSKIEGLQELEKFRLFQKKVGKVRLFTLSKETLLG